MSNHNSNDWHVNHRLDVIHARLELHGTPEEGMVTGLMRGVSHGKRRNLWTEANAWESETADLRMAPADWVHHVALVALQDRPNTGERLLFGLTGGLGVQDPLF